MDGFEQGEIGVGVVTGIRRWELDSEGWLCGLVHKDRWTQGENVAVHGGRGPTSGWATFTLNAAGTVAQSEPCVDLSCGQCGFYGYFGDRAQYSSGGVTGIVEGYGHVIIGTRGFRAQRARIVAVCPGSVNGVDFLAFTSNYPDVLVYRTEAAMLAAHPTDKGTEPAPDEGYTWFASFTTNGIFISGDLHYGEDEPPDPPTETPRERALRLRRERNTGPAKPRLDGRKP